MIRFAIAASLVALAVPAHGDPHILLPHLHRRPELVADDSELGNGNDLPQMPRVRSRDPPTCSRVLDVRGHLEKLACRDPAR